MEKKRKRIYIVIIILLLLLLIGAIIYIFCNQHDSLPTLPKDENAVTWEGEQKTPRLQNGQNGIAIFLLLYCLVILVLLNYRRFGHLLL